MAIPFLHALQGTFAEYAARPAVMHAGTSLTFGELEALVRQLAAHIQALGAAKGDRIVLCTADKRAFLLHHLAALYAGCVALPLNPRFTREELRFFLSDSGARIAVVDETSRVHVEALRADLPELRAVLLNADAQTANEYQAPSIAAEDPCLILYSSGTTGWPKGVVHTHANVASSLGALQRCWRMTPDDVVLNVLPLFHIHGLCFATLLTLLTGGCLILDDFAPQTTLERIGDCTVFMAVPTIYYRLLEQPNFREVAQTWTKPRLFTCGSAPIRAEVLPVLESILGKPVINRYGMTEAFVISSLPLDGPWPYGSVGRPLDGVEVRIAGEPGASVTGVGPVQIRGPNLFCRYWNKPEATQAAFADGWFDTGDLGTLDDAGFLTLVGRKNDLIITSGFNVYPQVVERVVNDCPGVRESAVVGIPDERKGERVAVAVVRDDPNLDEAKLHAFWTERLVDYQRPRVIAFLDSLPRNAMGKVLRRELQAMLGQRGEAS